MDAPEVLAYAWPTWKKWMYLAGVAGIQISMNYNTSVFPSAITPLTEAFNIGAQEARTGQMIYLGGLSTAGGSVTLGLIADLYQPEEQQYPLAFIVLSSCIGTSIGGVIGGPIQRFLEWQWFFWIMLIFGGVVQAIHFFMPESRSTILLDREAKRRRKTGEDPNIYGPNELKSPRISLKEAGKVWIRPFEMFFQVYTKWDFGILAQAWAFIPINLAYFLAYLIYLPCFMRDIHIRNKKGDDCFLPERRLKVLLWLAPLEPIGLIGFAWCSLGPSYNVHWIAPMIFSTLVGIANYAIYFSSVDYMIAAYGVYSASACGGNAFARDFLAGISAMYATPLYTNIGGHPVEYASTILAGASVLAIVPIYIFYWKGPVIRDRSKFAKTLAEDRKKEGVHRLSYANNLPA
ncbi:hypothetical protein FG05_04709 [Fusarium graminearum]|nr:hypothetical protein FG05_04709 [Fusarium graminearum]